MNPYYQVPEEPKRNLVWIVVVIVAAVVLLAGVLLVGLAVLMQTQDSVDTDEWVSVEEVVKRWYVIGEDYTVHEMMTQYYNRGSTTYAVEGEKVTQPVFGERQSEFYEKHIVIEQTEMNLGVQWSSIDSYEKVVDRLFSRSNGQRLVVIE